MSGSVISRVDRRIARAIEERLFPGCVVGIVTADGETAVKAWGRFTYDANASAVNEETVFDVASVTKAIPVACCALRLIDEKMISLDDQLIRFVPELRNSCREQVLMRHLLTQTLDLGYRLSDLKDRPPAEIVEAVYTRDFRSPPGEVFAIANATSILLGLAIERAAGVTLDRCADEFFFGPLGMARTTFFPERLAPGCVAPTEVDPWRGRLIQGEVHDESAWALRPLMIAGSAGLFSTAPDLLKFCRMILNRGRAGKRQLLSRGTIDRMSVNQLDGSTWRTGLGWELCQPRFMGSVCSPRTIGKTGFTGCSCVCNLERSVGVVILSNHTFPVRTADKSAMNRLRSDVADLVFGGRREQH